MRNRSVTTLLLSFLSLLAIGFFNLAAAADGAINGIVADATGKPIRGATVMATSGANTISRFTDKNGQYQISGLRPGSYRISVKAYGFEPKSETRDISLAGDTNFALKPGFNPVQMEAAELLTFLPVNEETRFLRTRCYTCHNLTVPFALRGMKAEEWDATVHRMAKRSTELIFDPLPGATPEQFAWVGRVLEKYFGPDSPQPTQDKVRHVEASDSVLQAEFHEFNVPTRQSFPHSIAPDNEGNGWFAEYSQEASNFGKVSLETGTITEYPITEVPHSSPHTPIIDKDGKVWMPLANAKRLSYLEPATGKITLVADPSPGAHTLTFDRDGNIWGSGGKGVFKYDKAASKFREWDGPLPTAADLEDSDASNSLLPGEKPRFLGMGNINAGGSYDVAVDSKNTVWYTQQSYGILVHLDPRTGEQKKYKFPGVPSSRGVVVDAKDNVWYTDWDGHKLVKFDPKTEQAKMYQPPTEFASPYGLVFDKTGNLWYADFTGNHITRFNPQTEKFDEFPIPSHNALPRFISVDDQGRIWFCEWWANKVGVLIPTVSSKSTSSKSTVPVAQR